MQPTCSEILAGCIENLQELVVPEVASPHARSAVNGIRMMLKHVMLRLDHEPDVLVADIREKTALLRELGEAGAVPEAARGKVASALPDLAEVETYVPLARLVAIDERLREGYIAVLDHLTDDDARGQLRAQMKRQIDRESAYILPALDGPPF